MSKKKLKNDGVYFLGEAAEDVTGSQYLVKFGDCKCLLECGLHQSSTNDYLDSYKINSAKFKFKPSEIDYVFVAHPHIDHCGLLPRLVHEGFNGQIICTKNTAEIMKPLLYNSHYIIEDEALKLSKRFGRNYAPLYGEGDVANTLGLIEVYNEYNFIYKLNDNISFQWLKNSHCLGAAQLQLILTNEQKVRKVLYTSDLGSLETMNHYLENSEIPTMFNDVVIMESTYGNRKQSDKKTRAFDTLHLKSAIDTVINRKGSVILPCFSFSRTQELLSTLYDIYGDDPNFKVPIVVDSRLSCDICRLYSKILTGDNLKAWKKVCSWENIRFISEKEDSSISVADPTPKIVISSSGFCTNGRVINYLKKYLPDKNSMVIFSGYTGDNSSYLSYRIKNYRQNRNLSINKCKVPNRADCMSLATFSSHANFDDLVRYGSNLKTNRLYLVHGSPESKLILSRELVEKISQNNLTYRVIISEKGMVARL